MQWYQVYYNGVLMDTVEAADGFSAIKAVRQNKGIAPDIVGSWAAKEQAQRLV